jgi:hypothetical protein
VEATTLSGGSDPDMHSHRAPPWLIALKPTGGQISLIPKRFMSTPLPPLMRDQRKVDAEHLKLLAVFHFVLAGFALVGLGFLAMHWFFMSTFFGNPEMWKDAKGGAPTPPPQEFFAIFKWFYAVMGVFIVGGGLASLISGLCILRRRARTFSLVVAGIVCLGFPFGTALGVFTFVVLLRDSVTEEYAAAQGIGENRELLRRNS